MKPHKFKSSDTIIADSMTPTVRYGLPIDFTSNHYSQRHGNSCLFCFYFLAHNSSVDHVHYGMCLVTVITIYHNVTTDEIIWLALRMVLMHLWESSSGKIKRKHGILLDMNQQWVAVGCELIIMFDCGSRLLETGATIIRYRFFLQFTPDTTVYTQCFRIALVT